MNDKKEFLATEPIGKLLLKLSIPTVVAQLINMLYNIVDRIYIGHMPGDGSLALTGVGVCMPIIMLVSVFAALMLRIYLGGLGLFGIQIACQMTFTSLGKAANSIVVAVVRKFVLLLPLIYIMPSLLADKTQAVYMAEPVADIIAVTFTAILFTFQFKKALKEIDGGAQC